MLLLADTHVHLYEAYDLDTAFTSAFANLRNMEKECGRAPATLAAYALFLTERHDSHAFERLRSPGRAPSRHSVEATSDDNVVIVRDAGGSALYLVAGRQIATRERLEVLALGVTTTVADGGDILDTIAQVRSAGGVPVLAWAPGKWTGRRGRVVQSVLDGCSPGQLLIGDTSMRPRGFGTPRLLQHGEQLGYTVVAGSDPLPFEGQESVIGRYGIAVESEIDLRRPGSALLKVVAGGGGPVALAGRRDSLPSVLARLIRPRLQAVSQHVS